MNQAQYFRVDVFTKRAFGGNQLAVFPDGTQVPENLMQSVAKEFNLSETTFVLPADDSRCDHHLRIFTPARELPMAGHPTVGTAFVLATLGVITPERGLGRVVFQEGVGPVPVTLEFQGDRPGRITMEQPMPEFGETFDDPGALAEMLSLRPEDLQADRPCQTVSTGVPYVFIPLVSLDAAARATLRVDTWQSLMAGLPPHGIYVYTTETVQPNSSVHGRMFAPGMGVREDPATGSAAGPLGAYLVKHRIVEPDASGVTEILCEQGFEMGRESFLHVTIEMAGEEFRAVRVGGETVMMGIGQMDLP